TKQVTLEETSQPILKGRIRDIQISPDGTYVCCPSGDGHATGPGLKNHPEAKPYSTYVYSIKNLSRPAFTLHQGAFPRAVAFDPKSKLVYAQNADYPLLVFTTTGARRKEYQIGSADRKDSPVQFLVHPDGKKLVALTPKKLWHLDLSKSSVDGKIAKPEPTASTEALALEVQKVGDLTVAPLNLDGKKYLRCFCWSADGKFLYALREDGLLRKIDAGTLKETIRLDLGQKCSWLALSSEGLVLTVPDAGEAWLVNPTTLK